MSYSENIDDISSILENDPLHHFKITDVASDPQYSTNEQDLNRGIDYTLPLYNNGDKPIYEKPLQKAIRKMKPIDEANEEDNEEKDDEKSQTHLISNTASNNKDGSRSRFSLPIPYTSSPHPQRHSRWTSRFLTHPSHWRASLNTPAIPLPLPDPQDSYNGNHIKDQTHSKRLETISSETSSLYHEPGSAKRQYKSEEWQKHSMPSSWTMDVPPTSTQLTSFSPQNKNEEALKTSLQPVSPANSINLKGAAPGVTSSLTYTYGVDVYHTRSEDASKNKQNDPNVIPSSFVEDDGDKKSIDAKNSFADGRLMIDNNGHFNRMQDKRVSVSNDGYPPDQSTSSSAPSTWVSLRQRKGKASFIEDNVIWPNNAAPNNHNCKTSHISFHNFINNRKTDVDEHSNDEKKTINTQKWFSSKDGDESKTDVDDLSSFSRMLSTSDTDGFLLDVEKSDKNKKNVDDRSSRKSDVHQVPVQSSLYPNRSSSINFQGKQSSPNIMSSTNKEKKQKMPFARQRKYGFEYFDTSLESKLSHEKLEQPHTKYNDFSSASSSSSSFHLPASHSSSSHISSSIVVSSDSSSEETHKERGTRKNSFNMETIASNKMQKGLRLSSDDRSSDIRQNVVSIKEASSNKPVQKGNIFIPHTTKKTKSPLGSEHETKHDAIINESENRLHPYYYSAPRTSALKSDNNKSSSRIISDDRRHGNRTSSISDSNATPIIPTSVFTSSQQRADNVTKIRIPHDYRQRMGWTRQQELDIEGFYRDYNIMDGAVTAIVLGGFFAFVCLLVVYKTKCKPMWKNRGKRLTTTPATASVADNPMSQSGMAGDGQDSLNQGNNSKKGSLGMLPLDGKNSECDRDEDPSYRECEGDCEQCMDEEHEPPDDAFDDFECIPLQTVNCSEEDDDDIFFLDEFGNYVFPFSTPTSLPGGAEGTLGDAFTGTSTNCSCQPSADELDKDLSRRVSQVSGASNAYTVKSLPGAYLYIPVLEPAGINSNTAAALTSFSTVKRSLSDPEIHFTIPMPFGGHPIILTVNPSSDKNGIGNIQSISNILKNNAIAEEEMHKQQLSLENKSRTIVGTKFQQRSYSMQQEFSPLQINNNYNLDTKLFSLPLKQKFTHGQGSEDIESGSSIVPFVEGSSIGSVLRRDQANKSAIDIQVIQPTPNMSPTESIGSSSGDEGRHSEMQIANKNKIINSSTSFSREAKANLVSNTPSIAIQSTVEVLSASDPDYSYSLTEIVGSNKPNTRRKVSFSSDETGEVDDNNISSSVTIPTFDDSSGSAYDVVTSPTSVRRRKHGPNTNVLRTQASIPGATKNSTTMSYLQVPGQPTVISQAAVAPQLSPEAKKAQMSSAARKRRATRLMKTGSFCSITSEGDGDIFELTGELKQTEMSVSKTSSHSLPPCLSTTPSDDGSTSFLTSTKMRKPSDPLSHYSEFMQDDCHSDISELFGHKSPNKHPSTSQRQSSDSNSSESNDQHDQVSAVYNLNLDHEDIVFVEVPYKGEYQITDPTALHKSHSPNEDVESNVPRKLSVVDSYRKDSVDVGVQSPPPLIKSEEHLVGQAQAHRKGSSEAKKKRKNLTIKKQSFVMPDIEVHNDGEAEGQVEDELYESSSCSVSIGSDNESSHQIITVPVTIEHPPPELRPTEEDEDELSKNNQWKITERHEDITAIHTEAVINSSSQPSERKGTKSSSQRHHHHHHHHHHRQQEVGKCPDARKAQENYEATVNDANNLLEDVPSLKSCKSDLGQQTEGKIFSREISTSEAGCQQAVPSSFVSQYYATCTSLVPQGTKTIKSADCSPCLKTKHNHHARKIKSEEPQRRAPLSIEEPTDTETYHAFNVKQTTEVDQSETKIGRAGQSQSALDTAVTTSGASGTAAGVRMVLVRDIGIQVSGQSPNLNHYRRFFKKPLPGESRHPSSGTSDSGGNRKYPAREVNVKGSIGATIGTDPITNFSTSTSANSGRIMDNQSCNIGTGSNVITDSNKPPSENKKSSSKKYPPEILF